MGRFMKKFRKKMKERLEDIMTGGEGDMNFGIDDQDGAQEAFESSKPDSMKKQIRMISGCEDSQTSADVSNVHTFSLPDPAGRAGGACTSTLLKVLYNQSDDEDDDDVDRSIPTSFTDVLETMRTNLKSNGYSQIPQLTSLQPIDVTADFQLVPEDVTGTRRAVMIGINYVGHDQGELSGCHNDVLNMKKYLMDVYGFEEENIVILMDDDIHTSPTKMNILDAYKQIIDDSEDGDAIFLHYSGHGTKLHDESGDEDDGYDEALVPLDYQSAGMILDDDLFDILIEPLPSGVHMVSLMDCCHSGTILDLPYVFKPNMDGTMPSSMKLDDTIDLDGLVEQFGGTAMGLLVNFFNPRE